MKRIYFVGIGMLCLAITFTGCTKSENSTEQRGYAVQGDTVKVMQANWSEKLMVEQVKSLPYTKKIVTAGTVRPIPTQYANIAPPFAGRVVKSYVRMGQEVKRECVCLTFLARISPPHRKTISRPFLPANSQ